MKNYLDSLSQKLCATLFLRIYEYYDIKCIKVKNLYIKVPNTLVC